jgi:hypothetical protein
MVNGRYRFFREAAALLERAAQTEDPREASELVKQAADILGLVEEFEREANGNARVQDDP